MNKLLCALRKQDGALLIEASVVLVIVFAVFFVILIVMVNVFQTSHLEGLAQDSLNYAIERCGTTFTGAWGRDAALESNLHNAVSRYIRRNTEYTVVSGTPQKRNQVRIRITVGGSVGNSRSVTLYLDTINAGYFGNQVIQVERGGQLGQEWVRGMGDNP